MRSEGTWENLETWNVVGDRVLEGKRRKDDSWTAYHYTPEGIRDLGRPKKRRKQQFNKPQNRKLASALLPIESEEVEEHFFASNI
jgi:hypothetical protein